MDRLFGAVDNTGSFNILKFVINMTSYARGIVQLEYGFLQGACSVAQKVKPKKYSIVMIMVL